MTTNSLTVAFLTATLAGAAASQAQPFGGFGETNFTPIPEERIQPSSPDLNEDGVVDSIDHGILLKAWGTKSPAFDLNGDGIVNAQDLAILLGSYSRTFDPADITRDGRVDQRDLMMVFAYWGQAGGAADVNGDGRVDAQDLAEVQGAWTR